MAGDYGRMKFRHEVKAGIEAEHGVGVAYLKGNR